MKKQIYSHHCESCIKQGEAIRYVKKTYFFFVLNRNYSGLLRPALSGARNDGILLFVSTD